MSVPENNKEGSKTKKSMLDITKEISNLHDEEHAREAIPGIGRDVVIS
jgi:hypothetical protein